MFRKADLWKEQMFSFCTYHFMNLYVIYTVIVNMLHGCYGSHDARLLHFTSTEKYIIHARISWKISYIIDVSGILNEIYNIKVRFTISRYWNLQILSHCGDGLRGILACLHSTSGKWSLLLKLDSGLPQFIVHSCVFLVVCQLAPLLCLQ